MGNASSTRLFMSAGQCRPMSMLGVVFPKLVTPQADVDVFPKLSCHARWKRAQNDLLFPQRAVLRPRAKLGHFRIQVNISRGLGHLDNRICFCESSL
ncbi:hypothetical protein FIBSPDRAFT_76656 [Athelia psychrophila]|uniref:Uncharacterized protein n=1 Tax=Athelia psychrophila TaxID=1759441 RepID=A0A166EFP8_9AGAM|nr:hypothetical protein FIBSPDRAFT_76656 [Fibularhizoctonia sp. CBS 109695]